MRHFLIAAAIALGAAGTPAMASQVSADQAFPNAAALDQVETSFVRHTREHRMMEIERNMERQQRRGYRGDGYGRRGDGYGRRGYGPPPHARGYGRPRGEYYRY